MLKMLVENILAVHGRLMKIGTRAAEVQYSAQAFSLGLFKPF